MTAVDLEGKKATLASGKAVEFTKVVFATGAVFPFPGGTEQVSVLLQTVLPAAMRAGQGVVNGDDDAFMRSLSPQVANC